MIITIKDIESGEVEIAAEKQFFDTEDANFEQIYQRLMVALEGITEEFLKTIEVSDKDKFRQNMYDILDGGFGQFLKKVFPEIKLGDFDLTAAAIVKAQDEIIREAAEQGISYEEMLDKYNELANEYVKARMN